MTFEVGKSYQTKIGGETVYVFKIEDDGEEYPIGGAHEGIMTWEVDWYNPEDLIDPNAPIEAVAQALDALLRQEGGATTEALAKAAIEAYEAL